VFFELWKDQTSSPEEGLSDEQGLFVFKVRQVGVVTVVARKSGYIPISKKVNFTKGFIFNTEDHLVMVPMVKEEPHDASHAYGILSFNGHVSNVQLEATAASNSDKLHVHKHQENCIQYCKIDVS